MSVSPACFFMVFFTVRTAMAVSYEEWEWSGKEEELNLSEQSMLTVPRSSCRNSLYSFCSWCICTMPLHKVIHHMMGSKEYQHCDPKS
jgi:hypothetical protein